MLGLQEKLCIDGETVFGLLAIVDGEALQEEGAEVGSSAAANSIEQGY
jgi:hypothetical protein